MRGWPTFDLVSGAQPTTADVPPFAVFERWERSTTMKIISSVMSFRRAQQRSEGPDEAHHSPSAPKRYSRRMRRESPFDSTNACECRKVPLAAGAAFGMTSP